MTSLDNGKLCTCNHVVTKAVLGQFLAFTLHSFVYLKLILFHHDRIEIDTSISVIVASPTTWEAHHSPRAKPTMTSILVSIPIAIVFPVTTVATQWFEMLQSSHCLPSHYSCNTMVWTVAESPLSSQSLRLQHNGLNGWTVPIVFPVTTVATQWFELLQSSHCLPSHYGCNTMVWTVAE